MRTNSTDNSTSAWRTRLAMLEFITPPCQSCSGMPGTARGQRRRMTPTTVLTTRAVAISISADFILSPPCHLYLGHLQRDRSAAALPAAKGFHSQVSQCVADDGNDIQAHKFTSFLCFQYSIRLKKFFTKTVQVCGNVVWSCSASAVPFRWFYYSSGLRKLFT